jgi:MoaA/NifB/PqqE/SkfB family radical SAM enzyme
MVPIAFTEYKRQTVEGFASFLAGGAPPQWPLEIFLELSNLCNLKCAMCGTFSGVNPMKYLLLSEMERGFMLPRDFTASIDSVLEHALVVHAFGYGEPTLHPEFKECIDFLSQYQVVIDFFTNGMKLDQDLCDFLVERRVAVIYVSFSGATKDDYENLYIGGSYETVLDGIERLARTKQARGAHYPQIHINSIAYEHHVKHLVEFVDLMASVGANHIHLKSASPDIALLNDHISICRPWVEGLVVERAKRRARRLNMELHADAYEARAVSGDGQWQVVRQALVNPSKKLVNIDDPVVDPRFAAWPKHVEIGGLKDLMKRVEPIRNLEKNPVPPSALDVPPAAVTRHLDIRRPGIEISTPCLEPFKTLYIQQDGTVKPCCFAPRTLTPLGDITRHRAEEVWRGAGFQATQEAILRDEYPMNICGSCIEYNLAPKHHNFADIVGTYRDWLMAGGVDEFVTLDELKNFRDDLPGNRRVVELHKMAMK